MDDGARLFKYLKIPTHIPRMYSTCVKETNTSISCIFFLIFFRFPYTLNVVPSKVPSVPSTANHFFLDERFEARKFFDKSKN